MNIIVTCGPSFEPIDEVRRLTNLSTGRLGVTLANALATAGHRVICLKGEQATFAGKLRANEVATFTTNKDLAEMLKVIGELAELSEEPVDAVFHAAALCDFKVGEVRSADDKILERTKIPTSKGQLLVRLVPTIKVLPKLRRWFPKARIVGWKYEVAGSCDEALDKAFAQIHAAKTDACVLNGPAYGKGFGFCARDGSHRPIADLPALTRFLREWLEKSHEK